MSKKKTDKFMAYKDKFVDGLIKSGATRTGAEEFWSQLVEFSKYAFNRSHAAAYAYTAFYTAWLKLNYPAEYMTAVLNHSDTQKLPALIAECREMGLEILSPDVNMSSNDFSSDHNRILFGLSKIKGMKDVSQIMEARKHGLFTGFQDFMKRGHSKKTITENLIKSGAMDNWCTNRLGMLKAVEMMASDVKEIKTRKEKLKAETDPKKQERLLTSIAQYEERFTHTMIPANLTEDRLKRLEEEYECLGAYISGHPLDYYHDVKTRRSYPIMQAREDRNTTICGKLANVKKIRTKKSGQEMAFFEIEDETGKMEVCCFHDCFMQHEPLIQDGMVVAITGNIKSEFKDGEDEEEIFKLFPNAIVPLERDRKRIVIAGKTLIDWQENILPIVKKCSGNEYKVVFHDNVFGGFRKSARTVSSAIMSYGLQIESAI